MGDKDSKISKSKIVLKADRECQRCSNKIERVLRDMKHKMGIEYESKESNSWTIFGPFDDGGEEVCEKLRCKAGRLIKEMKLIINESSDDAVAKPAAKEDERNKPSFNRLLDKLLEDLGLLRRDSGGNVEPVQKLLDKVLLGYFGYRRRDGKPVEPLPADYKQVLDKVLQDLGYRRTESGPNAGTGTPAPPLGALIAPAPVPAVQGVVAAPSMWTAPASSLAGYSYVDPSYDPSYYGGGGGYSYNPSYDPSYYGGGGYSSHGCGCGYGPYGCRCGKPEPEAHGVYYGVPVYDYDDQGCGTTAADSGTTCSSNQCLTVWSPYHGQ